MNMEAKPKPLAWSTEGGLKRSTCMLQKDAEDIVGGQYHK